jgi:hypothetical protein
VVVSTAWAQLPNPVLNSVFPPGGQVGKTTEVTVSGNALDGLTRIVCNQPDITFEHVEQNRFHVTIPKNVPTGLYDLRAVCRNGLSSPRSFFVGNRAEVLETEPNETHKTGQTVPLNVSINGRIEKGGDLDQFRFSAQQGQRVVIECQAERIDSRLRAVLEVYDSRGQRLAVNRGFYGIDPLIDFHVPADGTYVVKVFDLVYSGSSDHFYRLDIDTGPRVAFTVPSVVERGKTTRVALYGWNLQQNKAELITDIAEKASLESRGLVDRFRNLSDTEINTQKKNLRQRKQTDDRASYDRLQVAVTPPNEGESNSLPVRLRPEQIVIDGFVYHVQGGHAPILIGVTDVPVVRESESHQSPNSAQQLSFPCEVSGQLVAGDERDWYAIQAKRGEVLWFEAFGERIGSPVDLDLTILDSSSEKELGRFSDGVKNLGGKRFPSSHLDPSGRWVVPADGRYLLMIRNLIGGLDNDPRRVYRLSLRREQPDFHLAVVPRKDDPASININRGGRTIVDVLAFRRRGLTGSICVSATNLPEGIACPDIWLGPGVDRAPLTLTADESASELVGTLKLKGYDELAGSRIARGGTVVRSGLPNGWGRLTTEIPLAVAGKAPLRILADGHDTRHHHLYGDLKIRHSPGSILDVAVHIDRSDAGHSAPVNLIGVGLPSLIQNQTATILPGANKGYISFYLPPTLPVGRYTIAVQAQTTVPDSSNKKKQQTKSVTVFSNPVTFEVHPAAFIVEVDLHAPKKIQRGRIVQVNFTARRINGFINKIHTEVAAPDKVNGLRVRGVSFVGQTDTGTLQIIANEDAPLGRQPFVRLFAVGVVEDQPVYHGSCFLDLEIIE